MAGVHRAQQADDVKRLLARCKTKLVNVPGGCTSLVQPVDVSFNELFKSYIRTMSEKHMDENLDSYTQARIQRGDLGIYPPSIFWK